MNNDNIKISSIVLHLRRASELMQYFDNNASIGLLQLANDIINKYKVDDNTINEIDSLKNEIINENEDKK